MARIEDFERHRSLLFSIAYRMLGSVADAEDVVQEAYLRWQQAPEAEVRSPRSYLSAVVTRLSIDRLRSARARREEYVGPWLPEPLVSERAEEVAVLDELSESLSIAFLVVLESLNPVERAVFLLREVFDYDYEEISRILGKSEDNCRQIAHRARQSVAARRPRFERSPEQEERLSRQFLEACMSGDMEGLISLLSEDVTLWSDGGGKVAAAPYPIYGPERVARFLLGVLRTVPPAFSARPARSMGPQVSLATLTAAPQAWSRLMSWTGVCMAFASSSIRTNCGGYLQSHLVSKQSNRCPSLARRRRSSILWNTKTARRRCWSTEPMGCEDSRLFVSDPGEIRERFQAEPMDLEKWASQREWAGPATR